MLVDRHYARHMCLLVILIHDTVHFALSKSPANPLLIEIHHCILSAPDLLRWAHHACGLCGLKDLLQKCLMMEEPFLCCPALSTT